MFEDSNQRLDLGREVLSVTQLNARARLLLEDVFGQVWVTGEISNLARPASGHVYFSLKDGNAQVRCVLFRQYAIQVRHLLENGQAVQVHGKVSLYEGRGDFQLILDNVEPAGDGTLRLAFEALKAKLQAEGLFAVDNKQPLPGHPQWVGVVTSPSGAVIRDILSVFARRAPQVELTLVPCPVQGKEATAQIVHALQLADAQGFDALILARGGGSLEDLWCFNEEPVARAIAACKTTIISAVGHETDVTIADFVADVRAPTPSAAAELLAPDNRHLIAQLNTLGQRLALALTRRLEHEQLRLQALANRLRHPSERLQQQAQRVDDWGQRLQAAFTLGLRQRQHRLEQLATRLATQHPGRALAIYRQRLQALGARLPWAMERLLASRRQQLGASSQTLQAVSPLAILSRGYSILLDDQGKAIASASRAPTGAHISARLADGKLKLLVEESRLS